MKNKTLETVLLSVIRLGLHSNWKSFVQLDLIDEVTYWVPDNNVEEFKIKYNNDENKENQDENINLQEFRLQRYTFENENENEDDEFKMQKQEYHYYYKPNDNILQDLNETSIVTNGSKINFKKDAKKRFFKSILWKNSRRRRQ